MSFPDPAGPGSMEMGVDGSAWFNIRVPISAAGSLMETENVNKALAETLGTILSIADLTGPAISYLSRRPEIAKYADRCNHGYRLNDSLVELLPDREKNGNVIHYKHHAYYVVNALLDILHRSNCTRKEGNGAFPVAASRISDDARICGPFRKIAAHRPGSLDRKSYSWYSGSGPRVRWVTVLTDHPLPRPVPMESRCGNCTEMRNKLPCRHSRPFVR